MHVRTATAADLERVIEIGTTTWRATYPPITGEAYVEEGIARWWTPEAVQPGIERGTVLVAEDGAGPVAMASYSLLDDGAVMLWKLYVLPDAQGSGAGRALMTAVMEAGRESGAGTVRLTHLVGNDRAHAVYERLGFVEVGRVGSPIEGGPEEVVMERPL